MKILFLLNSIEKSGGTRLLINFANGLVERGHQVSLFAARKSGETSFHISNDISIFIASEEIPVEGDEIQKLWTYLKILRSTPSVDLIITTYYVAAYFGMIIKYLKSRKAKVIYFIQADEMLFPTGNWISFKRLLARLSYNLPLILFANSTWMSELIAKRSGRRSIIINPGVDTSIFKPNPEGFDKGRDHGLVMTIGRTQRLKGYQDFIIAVRELSRRDIDLKILVVSSEEVFIPPDLAGLIVQPESDLELVDCYHRSQVFVSSSHRESFGLPLLEAMACGTPVITTDSGGINEFAVHEHNCYICPPNQPEELSEAIRLVLYDNRRLSQYARAGIKTASRYSWSNSIDALDEELHSIMKS